MWNHQLFPAKSLEFSSFLTPFTSKLLNVPKIIFVFKYLTQTGIAPSGGFLWELSAKNLIKNPVILLGQQLNLWQTI